MKTMQKQNVLRNTIQIPVGKIKPNPHQPRQDFGKLEGMARTIKEHGVRQPLEVTDNGDGTYTLVTGERRLMAARLAKLKTVPAIVGGGDQAILALLENIQRDDLKPLEQAEAFQKLLDRGETQQSIADQLGVKRTYVAQKARLLALSKEAKFLLGRTETEGQFQAISESAARYLLRLNVIDKIATRSPYDQDNFSWANHYAHAILWHAKARTVDEVRGEVDWLMAILLAASSRYGGLEAGEAKRQADLGCQPYVDRALQAMKDKTTIDVTDFNLDDCTANFYCVCGPDFTKLTEANWTMILESVRRFIKDES